MVTVDLVDTLQISAAVTSSLRLTGDLTGDVPGGADNLVVRALEAAGVTAAVVLEKRIPTAAGLGGGSADAAAVLRWASVSDPALALFIGADVPFCLVGGRARVAGIGEIVEPLPHLDQSFTLLTPPFAVATTAVYRAWDDMGGPVGAHGNDLEPAALRVEPRLAAYRDLLWQITGTRPRLAGSGGTWFAAGDLADQSGDAGAGTLSVQGHQPGPRVVHTVARSSPTRSSPTRS